MNPDESLTAELLLGNDDPPAYSDAAALLAEGATVLVTGAGGSIGSEIVRQLAALGAARIVCADRDEYALYRLQLGLTGQALLDDELIILADIQSRPQMAAIFAEHRPELVFHAAACKHLPLLERSPAQAILTNVGGTALIAGLCGEFGARCLVNISTDKAADPISVLGQTKRLAEMAARHGTGNARVASVRFGNVFASRGSFIETVTYQLTHGEPVTITDPGMYRFFMTVPQAAGLVIEAAVLADGESVFMLDMGAPHRIVDLVRRYAAYVSPHSETRIAYAGVREGEKLTEVLTGPHETPQATSHPKIIAIKGAEDGGVTPRDIARLCSLAAEGASRGALRRMLAALTTATADR